MSKEIVVAFITLLGVVLSVVASLYTTSRQTRNELNRLRLEMQRLYSDKLLEKRLEIYPGLYFLLSSFQKKAEAETISREDLKHLYEQTNDWNSRNALLFSGDTGLVSFNFRQMLKNLLLMEEKEFCKYASTNEFFSNLKQRVGEFEFTLKSDVGIYAVEFSDLSKRFTSYQVLDKTVTELRDRTKNRGSR